MVSMTAAVVRLSLLASAVVLVAGCSTTDVVSPANVRAAVKSNRAVYAPADTFDGSFSLANKTLQIVRIEKTAMALYDLAFFDSCGAEAYRFNTGSYNATSYVPIAPLGTHTDRLKFRMRVLPPGKYRVHAWLIDHEDIYSETSVEIR
jgi:hypothetical protein